VGRPEESGRHRSKRLDRFSMTEMTKKETRGLDLSAHTASLLRLV
jgi:hypothetical protein